MAASVNLPPAEPLPPRPSAGAVEKAMLAHPGMSPDRGERILAAEVLHLRAELEAKGSELGSLTAQAMEVVQAWLRDTASVSAGLSHALTELAEHLGVE